MNILLLLASFGVGAWSALFGRAFAKWLIPSFVVAFTLGTVLSPMVQLSANAPIVNGILALGLGIIILLSYKPAKMASIMLMLTLGLVLGLLEPLNYTAILGQLIWIIATLIVGFIIVDYLHAQANAWFIVAKRILGVFIIAAVPVLIFLETNNVQPRSISTDVSGAITYTGDEQIDDKHAILESLIRTIYFAFNADGESAVYDQLAVVVDGSMLADLYLQQRRSHLLSETEGAEVQVESVELLQANPTTNAANGRGESFKANWQAAGSVSHAKHEHGRVNRYEAVVSIAPVDGNWKIIALELLDEQRTITQGNH